MYKSMGAVISNLVKNLFAAKIVFELDDVGKGALEHATIQKVNRAYNNSIIYKLQIITFFFNIL